MLNKRSFEGYPDEMGVDRRNAIKEELDSLVGFVLKNEVGEKLKEEDFESQKPGFTKKDIADDLSVVQSIKNRLAEEADHLDPEVREEQKRIKKRSEALEIIIGDQVELNDWFGPDAFLVRLADYDDFVNGADVVVEFDLGGGAERFAIAIDASFSTQGDTLERKIKRNIRKVIGIPGAKEDSTKPAEIKYFKSEVDDYQGRLEAVVPVVVGVDKRHCNQVMSLFADIIKLRGSREPALRQKAKEKVAKMAEHPVQLVLIKEIRLQLEMYLRLLPEASSERQESYTKKTQSLLDIFKEIEEEKENISREAVEQDRVFARVQELAEGQRTSRSFNPH